VNDVAENSSLGSGAPIESDGRAAGEVRAPAAAFFDLDGTLVVGQTTLLLVKFLRRAGVADWAFLIVAGLWFLGYKAGFYRVSAGAREKGAQVFKGLTVQEAEELMTRFADEILMPRMHPAVSAALAEHRAEGDRVAVISAALEPVVSALCARLDIGDYAGTACQLEDGRYTGRLEGAIPIDEEKARIAAEFMARWDVKAEDCWAYADHGSDLALLRSVGHPVAVNPRPPLQEAAWAAGWPIIR
jgi:HAD superfamily hydrolase (TIGR01490 family)